MSSHYRKFVSNSYINGRLLSAADELNIVNWSSQSSLFLFFESFLNLLGKRSMYCWATQKSLAQTRMFVLLLLGGGPPFFVRRRGLNRRKSPGGTPMIPPGLFIPFSSLCLRNLKLHSSCSHLILSDKQHLLCLSKLAGAHRVKIYA